MRKIFQVLLGTVMVAAAVLSCKKDEIKQETLEVSPSEPLTFSWNDAERVALEVTTTADSWDAAVYTDGEDWVTAQKEGTTLTISVKENDSESERNGKVTVSAGNAKPVEIHVTQTGKPGTVSLLIRLRLTIR